MADLKTITQKLIEFRDEREWSQFHDPKNLAAALSIEAAELNEIFLWKDSKNSHQYAPERVSEELADVLSYALLLADHYQLNILEIIESKMAKNAQKYPIELARGNSKKYTEL